jgi:hypothetical protein
MLYAETAESDTSRHTEIPPHTIRELEKTLQDLADLPASAPRRADPPPPLIPPAQLAPIILDDAPLFTEPLWAGVNTTMSPEQTPALNSAFAHDPLSSTSAPS